MTNFEGAGFWEGLCDRLHFECCSSEEFEKVFLGMTPTDTKNFRAATGNNTCKYIERDLCCDGENCEGENCEGEEKKFRYNSRTPFG